MQFGIMRKNEIKLINYDILSKIIISGLILPVPDDILGCLFEGIEMKNLRTYAIVDYLKQKKYCSIRELVDHFRVSVPTMYRDIAELTARDVVQKVRGGVALREPSSGQKTPASSPFQERISWNREKKESIALRALSMIAENDILFLDSSTTVYYLAQKLLTSNFSSLTIVTNAVSIIQDFHKFPSHYILIGLGGAYDLQLNAFLGQTALGELEQLSISKAFVSAFGLCDGRVTTNNEKHFALLMRLMNVAEQKMLLLDRSKIDRKGIFRFATQNSFDAVITE